MPLVFLAIALLVLPAVLVLAVPLSIFGRYRAGTARRRARPWAAALNFFVIAFSAGVFLLSAGICNAWVPGAFRSSLLGLAGGCGLGLVGLLLTRWEISARTLHYTPNRPLVLLLTLVVAFRLAFGWWRAWQAWQASPAENGSWLAAAGIPGSMAVGALMIGYYLAFSAGLWLRLRMLRR